MKKRVRIYKPTNQFAEGGQQNAQFTPDQLVSIYMTALSEPGSSIEEAEETLRQIGVDENTIAIISDNAEQFVSDEQYMNEALSTGDEDELTDLSADRAAEDAAVAQEQDALAQAEEEARSDRMQQMYADYNEPDYGDDTEIANQVISRYGGMPSKKSFVKNVMKQLGGSSEPSSVDSTDPDNKRKDGLAAFIGTVQQKADEDLMKKDAEAMYSMLSTPVGGDDSYYESPDMDYAQFGGMRRGRQRRMDRRMNKMIRNLPTSFFGTPGGLMIPNVYNYTDLIGSFGQGQMPAEGSYYRGPKMANIDVRRTGLFGRPKEYTITFDNDVVQNPQLKEELIRQEEKNKEQEINDEVKAAEEGVVDQGVEEKKQVEAEAEAPVDINDIHVVSSPRGASKGKGAIDAWGRNPDNKWYGFDPATKKWTKGTPAWAKGAAEKPEASKPASKSPLVEGTTYTVTDSGVKPLPNKGKQTPSKSGSKSSLAKTIGWTKIKNTAEDLYRGAPDVETVSKAIGWNKIKNTAEDLYNQLPDAPSRAILENWGILEPQQVYDKKTGRYYYPNRQFGGMTDQDSNLYKFIYGGYDPALPEVGGKLDNGSSFADGGSLDQMAFGGRRFMNNIYNEALRYNEEGSGPQITGMNVNRRGLFRKNIDMQFAQPEVESFPSYGTGAPDATSTKSVPMFTGSSMAPPGQMQFGGYRTRQQGLPYYAGTNQVYKGDFKNPQISSIKVKKTKAFGPYKGMPKKYTVNFQVERDPLSKRLSFDESGMKLDGQPMANVAPTRQGLFNRNQEDRFGQNLAERMVGSKVRPISVLGAKLLRNYTGFDKEDVNQNPDEWGIDQLVEDTKRRKNAEMVAQTQLPTRGLAQTNLPEQQLQRTQFVNAPSGISQSLPIRRPAQFESNIPDAEIIPTAYQTPVNTINRVEVPELEPGIAGPMGEEQAMDLLAQEQDRRGFGLNLLSQPTPDQDYAGSLGDANRLAAEDFMLEQFSRQNPDFYNQDMYNWEPDLSSGASTILNLNPPIVTPEQLITAQQAPRPINRVPKRIAAQSRNSNVVPSSREQQIVRKQEQTVAPRKQEQVSKRTIPDYDYNEATKDMSRQEKADFQIKEGNAFSKIREMRKSVQGDNPQLWRQTYRDYEVPAGIDKIINRLSNSQKLKFLNDVKSKDLDLYNALLLKYGEYGGYMAYGGTLPQAYIGEDTPINQDPRFRPTNSNFDLGATQLENPFLYQGKNPLTQQQSGVRMGTEGEYVNEGVVPEDELTDFSNRKEYDTISADYKTKGSGWGLTGAGDLIPEIMSANTAINWGLGFADGRGNKQRIMQELNRTGSGYLYGNTNRYDLGDYVTNSGDFRPNQQGDKGVQQARYGGMYAEGGTTWLSPAQVKWIMENGGDIEFIQ